MARLASQSQGGFYVTPPEEMALICNRLKVKQTALVNLLDPCAGKGEVLKQTADYLSSIGANPKTYGVELEEGRAEDAKQLLYRVVKGGYETLRASNEVFSFMWLNPPYDLSKNGDRMELNFLRDLTQPNKYLQPGGLLGFCIPQYVLKDTAQLLAFRFEKIKVYRFTDKNYPVYKQVVVFGYRMKGRGDPEAVKAIKEHLINLGESGPEAIPVLSEEDGATFQIPEAKGEVTLFRGSMFDPIEIAEDIASSPAWTQLENLLLPPNLREGVTMKNPVLPLKLAHMGTAIAAGVAGGNMGGHILVGITTKEINKNVEYDDSGGEEKHIELERHITKIRVFSQHKSSEGVFTLE
jgi:hypothetical protein